MDSRRISLADFVLPLLVLLLWCGSLTAQSAAGQLLVEIKDPSGAAVRAAGTLKNLATGASIPFRTDSQGSYKFLRLAPGGYQLRVSKAGFAAQSFDIEVQSGATISRTITLELARAASQVNVVAATPLTGTELTLDQVAGAVQTATTDDVNNSGALELGDFMNRQLNGVFLNDMVANPFQPDINFRGYAASPVLGTPEGVSVYVDGVRQNQPFGDVVSWDLIPKNAISEITLMPGSDPLFGLNTLGGALSVQTKDGVSFPGLDATLTYGSSGRKAVDASYGGGKPTGFNWFLTGTGFHESGWRIDSPSDVRQGFARLGWRTDKTDLALTMSYAYNTLLGNALQDYRLLAKNYASVYSIPDITANRSPSFNFIAHHTYNDQLNFSGNVWFRNIRTEVTNPNYNNDALGNSIYQPNSRELATLAAAGYTGVPTSGANASNTPFPKWRCIAEALQLRDPDAYCDGVTIYSKEVQNEFGGSGQFTWSTAPKFGRNQFTAGAAFDLGNIRFTQNAVFGYVNPNYTLTNVPAWLDGSTSGNGSPIDSRVNLHGNTPNQSVYLTDTLTLPRNVNLTVSGRYNRLAVNNTDLINPAGTPGSLYGQYVFSRFNPAIGVTWGAMSTVNLYASYTEGSRAPTAIELGCADPNNPCSLPNAFAADPPLEQVVTGTWEVGARGRPEIPFLHNVSWNVGAFRAENRNDILFVAAPQTGTGYFQNFAKTRREGLDANVDARFRRVTWGLDYTFLLATYQSTETLDGTANNTNDAALSGYPGFSGAITVQPNDRIPLIPKHDGKAYINLEVTPRFVINVNETAVSSSYARGNENNAYKADGVYYLGPGVSPGYAVTNFLAHYDLTKRLQLVVQIDNLFNRQYFTAAQLANTFLSSQGTVVSMPFPNQTKGPYAGNAPAVSAAFFSPGAPRRAWVELRARF